METQTIVRTEEHRVSHAEARSMVRELLAEADVTRVRVSDTSGHTLAEIPVDHEFAPLLMDAAASGAAAIADRVGDLVLEVEKEPGLTARAGLSSADVKGEPVRESMGAAGDRPANVTAEDVERIRAANRVPTGSEAAVERIEPEPKGEPELKDTGTPYSPGRKEPPPSR